MDTNIFSEQSDSSLGFFFKIRVQNTNRCATSCYCKNCYKDTGISGYIILVLLETLLTLGIMFFFFFLTVRKTSSQITLQELELHGRKICDGVDFSRYSQMILVLFSINDQLAR